MQQGRWQWSHRAPPLTQVYYRSEEEEVHINMTWGITEPWPTYLSTPVTEIHRTFPS